MVLNINYLEQVKSSEIWKTIGFCQKKSKTLKYKIK
jgi:hypothetical protein